MVTPYHSCYNNPVPITPAFASPRLLLRLSHQRELNQKNITMFTKTILVATALLLSATLALAQVMAPDFTPGRCSFDAVVSRDCDNNQITTFLDVSPFYDGAGNQFMEQTDFIDLTDGQTLTSVVVGKELKIGFERESMCCEFYRAFTEIFNRTDAI